MKRKGLSKNTISGPIFALENFLSINDIELRWKKIRRLLPPIVKKSGHRAWTTDQINQMLSFSLALEHEL